MRFDKFDTPLDMALVMTSLRLIPGRSPIMDEGVDDCMMERIVAER